jgi:prophage endopeptidase
MTRYLIAAAVVILTVIGLYRWGYGRGWGDRDAEMQAVIAQKNEESRAKERQMTVRLNESSTKLLEANNALDQKSSALDRAIRAGRVRLPAASCVQSTASTPAPSGDRQEARSESDRPADQPSDADRETLRLIAQIAADGDRAINQLNACIDAYNQVREQINGQR